MTSYYIEVHEQGVSKIVPHAEKSKAYKFMNKKDAGIFLTQLINNNENVEFRMVEEKLTITRGNWKSINNLKL